MSFGTTKVSTKISFGSNYPCGPCPDSWDGLVCECGWEFNEEEVDRTSCAHRCEICEYSGISRCPKCGKHLHCGGCV